MSKKLLITRPEHDDTTHYLSGWSKRALNLAESKSVKIFDLPRKRANKKEVTSILSKQNPELVFFNGHGNDNLVSGHDNEPLIKAGENEELLKGKITYAISCRSSKKLGPKSINSGAKAYIGYNDDFIFMYNPNKITQPLKDSTARLFLEPSSELMISLIKGNSAEESCKRSREFFEKNIRKLFSSAASKEETSMARYLWWDMKHQICLGDEKSRF